MTEGEEEEIIEAGLFSGFEGYRTPELDDYHGVLSEGLVVPDTNVFLNLYRYTTEAREDLLAVLERIGDQLWVPHQVLVEFWRNRDSVLIDPRDTQKTGRELRGFQDKASASLKAWSNRVSLPPDHPSRHLSSTLASAFDTVVAAINEFEDDALTTEAARDTNADPVLQRLEPLLRGHVGPPLPQEEYEDVVEEGDRRIVAKEPPGYKDRNTGEENGDYLVWEQVLREAARRKCDVLFVTGDVKEDWWRDVRGERRGPRLELVSEIRARAGTHLYMQRPTQLLDVARRTLQVEVRDESVEDADRIDRLAAERPRRITENVPCPRCDTAVDVALGTVHGDTAHGLCEACSARFFVHRIDGDAVVGGLTNGPDISVASPTYPADIPRAAYLLHDLDQSFPIVTREHWARIYKALSHATTQVQLSAQPTISELNALTRNARDTQEGDGRRVSRSELDYVAKSLLFAARLSEDMTAREIAGVFTHATLTRFQAAGLAPEEMAQIGPWLNPYGDDVTDTDEG